MDSIENQREPGNRASQPRVPSSKGSSIQNLNLLASLNLLEIRIMEREKVTGTKFAKAEVGEGAEVLLDGRQ